MNFTTGADLLALCQTHHCTIADAMLAREKQRFNSSEAYIYAQLAKAYGIMTGSAKKAIEQPERAMGGLIGGEAAQLDAHRRTHQPLSGILAHKAITYAMGVLEVNGCMGVIVAAPTAGSSGVWPGVALAMQEELGYSEQDMLRATLTAGAIGYLITRNASVSGAVAGCQAEVGSASAMAAAAAVELQGGTPEMALHAAGIALSNLLGLVCDPIGGLVEEPCQKRNAIGASNALTSADIALAGVPCVLPFDEMVQVMYTIGTNLPESLRETALGGMAVAPSARQRP